MTNVTKNAPSHLIVMGVSGCGKSTLAHALAAQLGWPMVEGDAFHPAANLSKMAAGEPLTDADRAPWLALLNEALRRAPHAVLSCSALKARYRSALSAGIAAPLFVHCHGEFEALRARLEARSGHFMPPSLLQSQFDALEMPNPAVETGLQFVQISIQTPLDQATEQVLARLAPRSELMP